MYVSVFPSPDNAGAAPFMTVTFRVFSATIANLGGWFPAAEPRPSANSPPAPPARPAPPACPASAALPAPPALPASPPRPPAVGWRNGFGRNRVEEHGA